MAQIKPQAARHIKLRYAEADRWQTARVEDDSQLDVGLVAPQGKDPLAALLNTNLPSQSSEDCLNLNIFIPEDASNLPVMFWLHGGGFVIGSGSMEGYNGAKLAAQQRVIVVSINYRLGALGFLRLCDISDGLINTTGNEGLGDQLCALQWVQNNIQEYGGNPDNVTLFGESAGAMSIAALLASPLSTGLFHQAILQSGAGHTYHTKDQANEVAKAFVAKAKQMGFELSELPTATTQDILAIQAALQADPATIAHFGILCFKPVVDGQTLMQAPIDAIAQGSARDIPIISGYNRDEWTLFAQLFSQNLKSESELKLVLSNYLAPSQITEAIRGSKLVLTNREIKATPQHILDYCLSEFWFGEPSRRLRNAHVKSGGKHFSYRLDFASPIRTLRATHCIDLGFIFGNTSPQFHGEQPRRYELEEELSNHWGAFAHNSQPLAPWPPYRHEIMIFGQQESIQKGEFAPELWGSLCNKQLAAF